LGPDVDMAAVGLALLVLAILAAAVASILL
jgi:hypothetical protein